MTKRIGLDKKLEILNVSKTTSMRNAAKIYNVHYQSISNWKRSLERKELIADGKNINSKNLNEVNYKTKINHNVLSKEELIMLFQLKDDSREINEDSTAFEIFSLIDRLKEKYSVCFLAKYFCYSKQAYYKWVSNGRKPMNNFKNDIANIITEIHTKEPTYGYKRISKLMMFDYGIRVNHKTVYRYMIFLKLKTRTKRKNKKDKKLNQIKAYSNLLLVEKKPTFKVNRVNEVWVCDITYITSRNNQTQYLFVIMDLYDRSIVGFRIMNSMKIKYMSEVIRNSFKKENSPKKLVLHSDRGTQFTSFEYEKTCKELGITISMSRLASPQDNAVIEAFFSNMKHEINIYWLISKKGMYETLNTIREFIWKYNNIRRQKLLCWNSPMTFRSQFINDIILCQNVRG